MDGKINKFENKAIRRVKEIKKPMACVPPNEEAIKMAKPKNNTIDEYNMLTPVSRKAITMLFLMLNLLCLSSRRYLDKKCIELSIEMPNAILNIKMVEGLIGTPI